MNNRAPRFVKYLKTSGTCRESQICILVIGGRIAFVKASDQIQYPASHIETGSRAVIDFAQLIEFGIPLILIFPVSAGAAVLEHLATCFLQASVGVYQFSSD